MFLRFQTALSICAVTAFCSNSKKYAAHYKKLLGSSVTEDEQTGMLTIALDELKIMEEANIAGWGYFLERNQSVRFSVKENPTTGYLWLLDEG